MQNDMHNEKKMNLLKYYLNMLYLYFGRYTRMYTIIVSVYV